MVSEQARTDGQGVLSAATPQDDAICQEAQHAGLTAVQLDDAAVEQTARLFHALGDGGRLRVLLHLSRGESCVGDLADTLGDQVSTVSQRLKLLFADGLVRRRREGKHVYYALADTHVVELLANGLHHAAELSEAGASGPPHRGVAT